MTPPFQEYLRYEPDTGIIYWRLSPNICVPAGAVAGHADKDGYIDIAFRRRHYRGHRIAWYLMTGKWPEKQIDHRNGIPGDNRWENLREATCSQNSANRRSVGKWPKGVTRHSGGRFQATICIGGKFHHLGLHDTPELAAAAYQQEAVRFFGEFARVA